MSIRNLGRSQLLLRTLSQNEELAKLVNSLASKAEQDTGNPQSLTEILKLVNPNELSLGAGLFWHGEASMDLCNVLIHRIGQGLRTFKYGFGAGAGRLHDIWILLNGWPQLKELELDSNSILLPILTDEVAHELNLPRQSSPPRPTYQLTKFALKGTTVSCQTTTHTLSWLLGETRDSLTSLELNRVDLITPTPSTNQFEPFLPHFKTLTSFTYHSGCATLSTASDLLQMTPNLIHFAYSDPQILGELSEVLFVPAKLRRLEVHGRYLYPRIRLAEALKGLEEDDGAVRLKEVTLVGPYRTDPELKDIARICAERSIRLDVKRMF